ncbi:MAG: TolC family protein [Deltaproteobacteria bacterium]|nr:TolC family protein [Deltaproteobacteria bacterium]
MKPALLATLAALLLPAASRANPPAAPSTPVRLSLRHCVQEGVKNHPSLAAAKEEVLMAEGSILGYDAPFDPVVSVSTSFAGVRGPQESLGLVQASFFNTWSLDSALSGKLRLGSTYSVGLGMKRTGVDFDYAAFNPKWESYLQASFSQPLLKGLGRRANLALQVGARHRRDAALHRLATIVQGHVERIAQAYWNLALALRLKEIAEELVQRAKDQHSLTMVLFKGGRVSQPELIQARAAIVRREEDLALHDRRVLDAETDLLRLVIPGPKSGWDLEADYRPAEALEAPRLNVDLEQSLARALEKRPEIAEAQASIRSRKALLDQRKNALLPSLELQTQVRVFGLAGAKNSRFPEAATGLTWNVPDAYQGNIAHALAGMFRGNVDFKVGLLFALPLGNSAAKSDLLVTQREIARLEQELRVAKVAITAEVRRAVKSYRSDAARLEVARTSVSTAQENLAAEQKKFRGGISTNFDVLRAQDEYAQARRREAESLAALNVAAIQYQRAISTLLDGFGLRLEGAR